MSRRLPPLNQLRAFEAAARHLSFKTAADELSVTQAAVSHQIRSFEEALGTQLFQRTARGVTLTDAAEALSKRLTQSFDGMEQALRRFESSGMAGTLRISVVHWYGNRVFLPALADFRAAYPELDLELSFSYEIVDLRGSELHAAVRHGLGALNRPGFPGDPLAQKSGGFIMGV